MGGAGSRFPQRLVRYGLSDHEREDCRPTLLVFDNRQAGDQINHGSHVFLQETGTWGIQINYYKYDGTD